MRWLPLSKIAVTAAVAVLGSTGVARADYVFSGAGQSGILVAPTESWSFNLYGSDNWGSPGVGAGTANYGEGQAAFGMQISFTGPATINPASIVLGNESACLGGDGGGTTFCSIEFGPDNIWLANLIGPSTINFIAQSAEFDLEQGQRYFVNILFDGGTPTGFTGRWLTDFQPGGGPSGGVPEPATWALMIGGFGLAGVALRRRRMAAVTT